MLINAGPPFKGEANNVMNGGSNSPWGSKCFMNGAPPRGEALLPYQLCIMLFKRFVSFNNAAHDFVTHHILLAELNHANSGHIT